MILYTSGTTGHPKGAELTHGNLSQQHRGGAGRHCPCGPGRRHLRRTADVPRVRADRRAQRGGGGRRMPDPAAAVRRRARPADHRRSPGHRLRRRADHVRGAAARSLPRGLRHLHAADVHLRRRRAAGRGAARVRGGVRGPGAGGLRPVGDPPVASFNHPAASASPVRSARPSGTSRCGSGRRRPRGPAGRGGRDRHPRAERDEGLLAAPRGHRRGDRRRLVPHRRPGPRRRGRLLLHRGPEEGPDHPRRLQRLPAGDRGSALRAPRGRRGRRDRAAAPRPGRGSRGRDGTQAGGRITAWELRDYVKGQVAAYKYPRQCGSSTRCPRARPARS